MKLLDSNVWLAAAWRNHSHHGVASRWMNSEDDDLAFCRVTQMALLRLVTNPAITQNDVMTRRQAWEFVERFTSDPRVRFLAEPQGLLQLWMAFSKRDDKSHLLWTDDYLAAFAQAASVELVTLDRALHKRYTSVKIALLS
jgi:toxin-antitoxin system PIN domain toxin